MHYLKQDAIFNGISFHFPELDILCSHDPEQYFVSNNKPLYKGKTSDDLIINIKQGIKDKIDLYYILSKKQRKILAPDFYDYIKDFNNKEYSTKAKKQKNNLEATKAFYFINISGKKKTLGEYMKIRNKLEKIFSIFLLEPIYSDFCIAKIKGESYRVIQRISKIKDYKDTYYRMHLPVSINQVTTNLIEIIDSFNNLLPTNLLESLIFDRIYNKNFPTYQQFIITTSVIGGWQHKYSNGKKKYEDFFSENLLDNDTITDGNKQRGLTGIKDHLESILGGAKNFSEMGKDIGHLRDCIAHFDEKMTGNNKILKRYKHILDDEAQIANLCDVLFCLLIYAIYKKIGIELNDDQKCNFLRCIRKWNTIPN